MVNHVKDIYSPFTADQISAKISEILKPKDMRADLEIIYQSISSLHIACPDHKGDWYFSGEYPTPGGNKVVTQAFINYVDGVKKRAY
jgi:amidophosphoribosyltransferase